jgi:ATP-dependent protease Clp ATPase subunit
VYICNECVKLSAGILSEELQPQDVATPWTSTPRDIKNKLDAYVIAQESVKKISFSSGL